jgi:hypothetical protein
VRIAWCTIGTRAWVRLKPQRSLVLCLSSVVGIINMRMCTDYHTLLVNNGIQLGIPGLKDIALQRADALYGVKLLRTTAIPILGGDVWFRRGSKIEPAYANWHTDGEIGEDKGAYLHRTWDSAERYIREFPVPTGAEPLFVLVTAK